MSQLIMPDGEPLDLQVLGQGRPVIFLHGWTSGPHIWKPFLEPISDDHLCVCWTARGHHHRPLHTETPVSLGQLVKDLHFLIHTLGLARPVLVGHSMGALLAWRYIQTYGDADLRALVIVDQSPKLITDLYWPYGIYGDFPKARSDSFLHELQEDFPEAVLRLAARGLNSKIREAYEHNSSRIQDLRKYLRQLYAPGLIRLWQDVVSSDFRDIQSQIQVPVLLQYGARSQFYPLGVTEWLMEQIPQAELVIYPEADHSPQLTATDAFLEDLQAFLAEVH